MPEVLKLSPFRERRMVWDLAEILDVIRDEGAAYHWRAISAGGSTEFEYRESSPREDAVELWGRIEAAPSGLPLAWPELLDIAANVFQTAWLTLLAFSEPGEPDLDALFADDWRYLDRATPAFFARLPLALQCVDGNLWLVHARDAAIAARFARTFATSPGFVQ